MASGATTPSEGEIVDAGSHKAKSRSPSISSSVNRQSRRPPVRYSRSPSPTASDRHDRYGSKRARDDDHYNDPRRSRHRRDDRRHDRADRYRRASRERYRQHRSRSPPRFRHNDEARDGRNGARSRRGEGKEQSVSNRSDASAAAVKSSASAETRPNKTQQVLQERRATQEAMEIVEPEPESQPVDIEALREQKRKRWDAIRAKHRGQPGTPLLLQALDSPATPGPDSEPTTPRTVSSRSPSPMDFSKDAELANNHEQEEIKDDGPAAADYDPTTDMQEDKQRHDRRLQHDELDQLSRNGGAAMETDDAPVARPKEKDEFDMFAEDDDDDDMFAEGPSRKTQAPVASRALNVDTMDDWDDEEGYYKVILGELLDARYHVQSNLGKGMFSGVVRALDQFTDKLVAIKLIRSNETMRKAAAKEINILEKLKAADPEDKRHIVRLERSFEHKGHLCMVFENLNENLREVLKKFGRDIGIELQAVRIYAQQMFKGLGLLRKCDILHADLKPDNILVNDKRNWLKICDLGSASDSTENEITPYLVSRFYRAPEIILGMPYDFSIDTWSIGCTLYELFTGKILFTGRSNNQMLRAIMECRGRIPTRMLKRSEFAGLHFDEAGVFRSIEKDKITGQDVVRMHTYLKPTKDLKSRISTKGLGESEAKDLNLFIDFLDKCLILNPEKRLTPADALKHPFLTRGKI